MRFWHIMKVMGKIILIALLLIVIVPLVLRAIVAVRFRGDIFTVEAVPPQRVAIIFGARVYSSGAPSAMLADRVAAGVDLYRQGKAQILLMTGDNSTPSYDEPSAMKRQALQLGVPEAAIVLDYAGRRTYDSCYRARDIFKLSEAVLVSQQFHLDRALMLCNGLGIQSVGVAADYKRPTGYSRASITYSQLREFPAVTVAALDLLFRPTPILGDPLPIFPEDS